MWNINTCVVERLADKFHLLGKNERQQVSLLIWNGFRDCLWGVECPEFLVSPLIAEYIILTNTYFTHFSG